VHITHTFPLDILEKLLVLQFHTVAKEQECSASEVFADKYQLQMV
jgi:hypothetical protein